MGQDCPPTYQAGQPTSDGLATVDEKGPPLRGICLRFLCRQGRLVLQTRALTAFCVNATASWIHFGISLVHAFGVVVGPPSLWEGQAIKVGNVCARLKVREAFIFESFATRKLKECLKLKPIDERRNTAAA